MFSLLLLLASITSIPVGLDADQTHMTVVHNRNISRLDCTVNIIMRRVCTMRENYFRCRCGRIRRRNIYGKCVQRFVLPHFILWVEAKTEAAVVRPDSRELVDVDSRRAIGRATFHSIFSIISFIVLNLRFSSKVFPSLCFHPRSSSIQFVSIVYSLS